MKIMTGEYDFSKGAPGKFHRKGAELRLPIYLDAKLQRRLERLAREKGKDIGEMANQLVGNDMDLLEALL